MKLKLYQCSGCNKTFRAKSAPKACSDCSGTDLDAIGGKEKKNRAEKYSRAEAKAGLVSAPTAKPAKAQPGISVYQVFRDQNGIAYLRVEIRKTGLARFVVNKGFGVEVVEIDRATIAGMNLLPVPGASILNAARRLAQPLNSSVVVSLRAHEQLDKILNNTEMIEMKKAKKFARITAPTAKKSGNSAAKTAAKKEKTAKAPKAAKVPKAKAEGKKGGFSPEDKIHLIVKESPRRPGSKADESYQLYAKSATVADFLKKGGDRGYLNSDALSGVIKVG